MSGSAGYDPKIIERFADQLLGKADSVRVGAAVCGGVFGVMVGSIPLTPLQSIWPIPGRFGVATMLLGTLIGILVGYVIGEGRAFRYRVEAQRALFQVDIEKRVTAAVKEAVAQAATAAIQGARSAEGISPAPPPPPVAPAPPASEPEAAAPVLRPPELPPQSSPELPPLSPAASA